jgi:hypothetical protein
MNTLNSLSKKSGAKHREEKTKSKDAKNAIQENGVPGKPNRAA